jgi:hypothetical protein
MRRVSVVAVLLVALVISSGRVAQAAAPTKKRALVTWRVHDETFRTYLNVLAEVALVRDAIRAGTAAGIPIGRIYRGTRENRSHAWHLRNVRLADVTIELCDGRPSDLDADLDYWVGTVKRYCPWGAEPLRLRWVSP